MTTSTVFTNTNAATVDRKDMKAEPSSRYNSKAQTSYDNNVRLASPLPNL